MWIWVLSLLISHKEWNSRLEIQLMISTKDDHTRNSTAARAVTGMAAVVVAATAGTGAKVCTNNICVRHIHSHSGRA